nr:MAG TPA: hypothetical protein [Caudoviricetes sp.]
MFHLLVAACFSYDLSGCLLNRVTRRLHYPVAAVSC